jgi:hypothetical protein
MIIVVVWVVVIIIAKERGADPTKTRHNMHVFVACMGACQSAPYIQKHGLWVATGVTTVCPIEESLSLHRVSVVGVGVGVGVGGGSWYMASASACVQVWGVVAWQPMVLTFTGRS